MLQETLTIINSRGLHARAATKLVKTALTFDSDIHIEFDGKTADCKSVMSILLLAATVNSEITLTATGCDEQNAIDRIKALFSNKFGEDS
ncbi:HPr family phosphocarrier protein [Halioxenophilus aromaticivorans]|uniref:HPr family phosphocarrier protein n=1 Tax=Halioxenophilus aromaticivorans TaxID=1306992 RepID=A0AAV3U702_9ALTE